MADLAPAPGLLPQTRLGFSAVAHIQTDCSADQLSQRRPVPPPLALKSLTFEDQSASVFVVGGNKGYSPIGYSPTRPIDFLSPLTSISDQSPATVPASVTTLMASVGSVPAGALSVSAACCSACGTPVAAGVDNAVSAVAEEVKASARNASDRFDWSPDAVNRVVADGSVSEAMSAVADLTNECPASSSGCQGVDNGVCAVAEEVKASARNASDCFDWSPDAVNRVVADGSVPEAMSTVADLTNACTESSSGCLGGTGHDVSQGRSLVTSGSTGGLEDSPLQQATSESSSKASPSRLSWEALNEYDSDSSDEDVESCDWNAGMSPLTPFVAPSPC